MSRNKRYGPELLVFRGSQRDKVKHKRIKHKRQEIAFYGFTSNVSVKQSVI